MKITCQACQAKYTIADEKVAGKVVKIRCKKCGASIVVNGNDPSAGASQRPALEGVIENVGPLNAQGSWTVNVADGDQRTMTEAEIVASYATGVVTEETFCWQEGMADWLPVREIVALYAVCVAKAGARAQDAKEEGLETKIQDSTSAPPATRSAAAPPARPSNHPSAKEGNGSLAALAPAAAMAARRPAGRNAAADLFSSAARAGGEEDVLTSAPAGVPPMHDDGKLMGARNENSLLFGLQEKGGAPAPSMTATNEASGLIDIRQLSAQMRSTDEKKQSRVDDIMNLGGGGQFSPSLGAPILTAPSLEAYSQPPPPNAVNAVGIAGDTQARNKAMIFLALGGGTFFLVAAIGVAVLLLRSKASPSDDHDKSQTSTTEATPTGGASVAMNPPATGVVASAPRGAASPEVSSGSPSQGANAGAKESPPKDTKETAAPKETAPKEPKPTAVTTPKETATTGAPAAEFNMGEARSRLAGIAGGVQSCKRGDTTGGGKVEIVFAPSGGVQSANLMSGSPFDGTPTGKCVEARFRGAHVPAFGGSPFTVTKSFSIN
ncbi:MAG: zinc-ribbon domain-containing protein [Myxococcota bacterium]|nr:zinc-ribbon domain-containing protein [Myxococcota bacterium]